MKKNSVIKIIGIASSVLGVCATLISDWVTDKEIETQINEGINKAFADRETEKES